MPVPGNVSVRAFNHPLGSSPVDILAPPLVAHRLRERFPCSLDGEPFLRSRPVTDYRLEARGGSTLLRVVTSGFPADPSWDAAMVFHEAIDTIGHHFMQFFPPRMKLFTAAMPLTALPSPAP